MAEERSRIARRVAMEFRDGQIVNLGIGMPTMAANFVPDDVTIVLQSENGFVGMGPSPEPGTEDPDLINAGNQYVTVLPGAAFFDSALSFAIIRGGHVDVTVLGALEVDELGNIASYIIPGKLVAGMGGAMDLCTGARRVIIAITHCDKRGNPKIRRRCTLPLTAVEEADLIVTDKAVIERTAEGLILREVATDSSVDEVVALTEATLIVPAEVGRFD
ncbi:MAG: 3-oxoacid CoA-transferase subunit B [Spirochaetaceae bacterium]|nr:MAG: 3-oxoacid CoA-transferase subunit B [Spirochaetaceae bacterium]